MARKEGGGKSDPRWRSHVEPAPGDLRILHAWLNSGGGGGRREQLANPRALADWLARWGLLPSGAALEPADLELARESRSGLRAMIRARDGVAPAPEILDGLDRVSAAAAGLRVRCGGDGYGRFEPEAEGVGAALARLLEHFALASHDRTWDRFKLCAGEDCGAVYYDFSSGLVAKWCSKRCADRPKAKRYRQRRKRYEAMKRRQR